MHLLYLLRIDGRSFCIFVITFKISSQTKSVLSGIKILKFYRILSFDIVIGALASSLFFVRLLDQQMPPLYWIILASTVWLIYLTDHLADSYSESKGIVLFRKLFFKNNQKIVTALIVIVALFTIVLLFFAPIHFFKFGIPGAILIALYLLINQVSVKFKKYIFPRELIISVLYLYGVCGLPIIHANTIRSELYPYLVGFLLLILGNVLIYAFYEARDDALSGVQTLSLVIMPEGTRKLNLVLLLISCGIFSYLLVFGSAPITFSILGLIIAVGLFVVQYFTKFFAQNKGYGIIADGIFLTPLILLLF